MRLSVKRSIHFGQNLLIGFIKPTKRKLLALIVLVMVISSYISGYGWGLKKSADGQVEAAQAVILHKEATANDIKFDINSYEFSNQVVIDGKSLKAPANKQFLIIRFFAENPGAETVNLQPVNLFRLVDATDRHFAPELYNKETMVLPKSVKADQVGFMVDQNSGKLTLEFGDILGEKTNIELTH